MNEIRRRREGSSSENNYQHQTINPSTMEFNLKSLISRSKIKK